MTHYRLTKRGMISVLLIAILGVVAWYSGGLFLAYFGLIVSGLFILALGYELFFNKDTDKDENL